MRSENTYKCIITGEEKYIPPSLVKSKIKRFGTADEYRKYYVSKPAAKLIKNGKTVDEVRGELNAPADLPGVDLEILIKLKLVKVNRRKGKKEAEEHTERLRYLNSDEFRNKKLRFEQEQKHLSYSDWVQRYTGTGKERGGTCIRPDIFLTWNDRACDGCTAYEFCECDGKRLSHEKRKPKRR